MDDFDLSTEDFVQRVNSDLVGKITNLASRGAQMLGKNFEGRTGKLSKAGTALAARAEKAGETIAGFYEERDFSKAVVEIRKIADEANKY